jgi:mannitol/fructose-specific phosphotransferase system IIA component (Ntr-type)
MQLTFRDIERAFGIEEETLYQWLNSRAMPAVKANGQYYFNSVEVLEWALKNKITLSAGVLKLCEKNASGHDIFMPALIRGGVHFGIIGNNREDVFGNILNSLPLPSHIQRPFLKEMLVAREQAGTTGVGSGIAIPHVKHPVVLAGVEPIVGLFFLENKVDFGAFDKEPVQTVFLILSGSFKGHLSLLSRLAFCLQDDMVKAALKSRLNPQEIFAAFKVAESKAAVREP